jgi:hypothetical protein
MGEISIAYNKWAGKPKEKTATRRPKGDNNAIDSSKIACELVEWINMVAGMDGWKALVNTAMNLQAP